MRGLVKLVKRAVPFVLKGVHQTGVLDKNKEFQHALDYVEYKEDEEQGRPDTDSWIAYWVPELNPRLWLAISFLWCLVYAIPLVGLLWLADSDATHFCYSEQFYITVNVASCVCWVVASLLSGYWYWKTLGLSRGIELLISVYFLVDVIIMLCVRDTTRPKTRSIVISYGVSLFAYLWSIELGITSLVKMSSAEEEETETPSESVAQEASSEEQKSVAQPSQEARLELV